MSTIKIICNKHKDFLKYLFANIVIFLVLSLLNIEKKDYYFMFLFGKLQNGQSNLLAVGVFFLNRLFEILFLSSKYEKLFMMFSYIISRHAHLRKRVQKRIFFVSVIESLVVSTCLLLDVYIFSNNFKSVTMILFVLHFLSLIILQNLLLSLILHKLCLTNTRAIIIVFSMIFCFVVSPQMFQRLTASISLIYILLFVFCSLIIVLNTYMFRNFECFYKEKNK